MKYSRIMESLTAVSLVVDLFAGKSRAADYTLTRGTFTVTTHIYGGYVVTNPNVQ